MKSSCRRGNLGLPKCRHCGRVFKTEERRDQHMKNHDQLQYRCSVNQCGYFYDDLLELRFHWRDVHKLKFREVDPKNYAVVNYCRDKSFNARNRSEENERQSNSIQEKVVTEDEGKTETDRNNNQSVAINTESSFNTFSANKSNKETERQSSTIQEKVVTEDEDKTETDKNNNHSVAMSTESTFVTVSVMEKDGDQVGTVDVHATKDGAAVQRLMKSDRNERTNYENLFPSRQAINLQNKSDQTNHNNQEQCEKEMQNIVENLQQDKNGDSVLNNADGSVNISTPLREDTKQLFAENCSTRNDDGIMLTNELLNSSFDVLKSFLDTDLLNETFTSDIFDNLLTSEDNALLTGDPEVVTAEDPNELENGTECTLKINSCFSLATNISDGADKCYYGVLGDRSYSRQQSSPHSHQELAYTACENNATPTSLGSSTLSSLLDGLCSDVDNCPEQQLHTKNAGSTTPAVDVSVDSGVDDLNSIHSVTVDTVTLHAGLPQISSVELKEDSGSVVKTERNDEETRYFTH